MSCIIRTQKNGKRGGNRIEQNRIEQNRIEQNIIEQNRIEQNRIEQNRIEQNRIEIEYRLFSPPTQMYKFDTYDGDGE